MDAWYCASEMTNSGQPIEGKRERLVRSAANLLYRRGVDSPTLAEIAQDADVPPGNVYYYFKTRDELIEAVIDTKINELGHALDSLSARADPRARLKGLARLWTANQANIATSGCPIGTLCSELNKRERGLDKRSAVLLATAADWIAEQLRQLGCSDAPELAITILATVQGAALLANTLRDPKIMTSQIRRLERWIDTLGRAGT
jgi:TetR/AcrR family transcriptional regulator, transcriptional repressor for nem operon